ncbi:MAG TPA: PH domain-containing protein [Candidatus Nanopelagicales bacterium]|nr:PH domain-containing protein [Candidatus Nanopelagicales bacterium]
MDQEPDTSQPPPPQATTSTIGDDLGLGLAVPGSALIDAEGHRKVHPISPLIYAVAVFPAMGGIGLAIAASGGLRAVNRLSDVPGLESLSALSPILAGIAVIAVIAALLSLVVAAYQFLAWRALSFWFDDDGDFRVQSGVLFRQQRRVQLSRIQAVDVTQPLAARVFSMAALVIEVAGQDDSRVRLKYLTLADAREIRREVLARSAGLAADTAEAPQDVITTVPAKRLAMSLLLRLSTVGLLVLTALIVVGSYVSEGWAGIGLALVTGGVPLIIIISEFIRFYGFTIARSPDGLRLHYGLLRTESRTVPPGRVQAIEYVEPLLWRRFGWTRVLVTIAGVGNESSGNNQGQQANTVLIPVAHIEQARELIAQVLPDLKTANLEWVNAPTRAWKRSPVQWRNLAAGWDEATFAVRRGRITRRLAAVPHARTQSVRWTQGPWERALDLASVHVDTTPGPVSVSGLHLAAADARAIAIHQAQAAREGRRQDRSIHWAQE